MKAVYTASLEFHCTHHPSCQCQIHQTLRICSCYFDSTGWCCCHSSYLSCSYTVIRLTDTLNYLTLDYQGHQISLYRQHHNHFQIRNHQSKRQQLHYPCLTCTSQKRIFDLFPGSQQASRLSSFEDLKSQKSY